MLSVVPHWTPTMVWWLHLSQTHCRFFYLRLNIFGKAARLQAGPIRVQIPQETRNFSLFLKCPEQPWGPSSLQLNGYRDSCQAVSGQSMIWPTHLHLVPGLKMSGAMPLLPLYASMAWTGETLLYNGSCPKFQAWLWSAFMSHYSFQ